jgi:hypothetical protein
MVGEIPEIPEAVADAVKKMDHLDEFIHQEAGPCATRECIERGLRRLAEFYQQTRTFVSSQLADHPRATQVLDQIRDRYRQTRRYWLESQASRRTPPGKIGYVGFT